MNSTVITGNLVRDPELRSTASGTAVANFSVADNRRWADPATGERREATTYVDVVAWGDLGRHVAQSLRLGDRVTVSGRLEQRSWQSDQGERRSKLELTAADVAASLRWATVAMLEARARRRALPGPGLRVRRCWRRTPPSLSTPRPNNLRPAPVCTPWP